MSLRDTIMAIVCDMIEEAADLKGQGVGQDFCADALRGYAKKLKEAVLAAPEEKPPDHAATVAGMNPLMMNPMIWSAMAGGMHEKALTEARKAERKRRADEGLAEFGMGEDGSSMVRLVGGPHDGTHVGCPDNIKVGSKTNLDGAVYVMGADKKAHYDEAATKELGVLKPESRIVVP